MAEHIVRNHRLVLLPEKAIFWPAKSMLFLGDSHFGKAAHFRKAGLPVPMGVEEQNLYKFQNLLLSCQAQEVVFLGDLFHSEANATVTDFKNLLDLHPNTRFTLVKGNHDILPKASYNELGLHLIEDQLAIADMVFSHEKLVQNNTNGYNLYAHVHPAVHLKGNGKQRAKLPCFYFSEKEAMLPAFGEFTGKYVISPKQGDSVYVIAGKEVIAV